MKKFNFKRFTLLLLVLTLLLTVACEKKTPPAETGETNTSSPEITENTPTEGETTPPATEAPTEEITVIKNLTAEEAMAALESSDLLAEQQPASKEISVMTLTMGGMDMGSTKTTKIMDGTAYSVIEEADGLISTTVILPNIMYISESYEGEVYYDSVPLTADQFDWVVEQYELESSSDGDFSYNYFLGLSGKQYSDGTIIITATGFNDQFMNDYTWGDDIFGESASWNLTFNSCEMIIAPNGLPSALSVDMDMSGSVEEDGISVDFAVNMKAAFTAEYGDFTIAAPENVAEYTQYTFDEYLGLTPDADEAANAGLPLDQNSYVIGAEDSKYNPDDQFLMLAYFPSAYEGKTFEIYGVIGMDEELGVSVIYAGEYGTFFYYCPQGVNAPVHGDTVKITATFENTVDKGYDSDYTCYTMMVSACEVLAHGVGPNGGRIMFITASSLNVRTSSDTSSNANILGTLSKGDAVEVFDQDEKGWWRIEFNGQTAYISNKYVSETKPE